MCDYTGSMQPPYWFKRRRYGWGFTPVTWQGWLSLLVMILIAIGTSFILPYKQQNPSANDLTVFFIIIIIDIIGFFILALKTSPAPKWRWGKKSTDNPKEDF